jgi:hypothetical protein
MVLRYDLHFPKDCKYANDNQCLTKFINSFTSYLRYKGIDSHYLWVRESAAVNHHYHLAFLLDGRLTRRIEGHLREVEKLWALALGLYGWQGHGLVYYCQDGDASYKVSNGEMLKRGCKDRLNECFYWLSYLAKTNTKGEGTPLWIKEFGCSQLRRQV